MDDFGKRLKTERLRLGLNKGEMAKELKISPSTMMNIELNKSYPSESTIRKTARKLGWKDGLYEDYYYGVDKQEAKRLFRKAEIKAKRMGLYKRDFLPAIGTSPKTYERWQTELDPRGKRLLLKFIHMDEDVYKEQQKKRNDKYIERIDAHVSDENPLTGAELRKYRTQRGLTLAKLASKIGVNNSTIGKWERGGDPIPPNRIRQFYKFFGLNYYEPKRVFKSEKQREKERQQRVVIMRRMDRKVDSWTELDDNDPDLVELRKLVGVK